LNASLSCLRRDTDAENDGGVNNDPEVRSFLASVIGNGHGQAPRVLLHTTPIIRLCHSQNL
jgi:hypothetical protein